MAVVTLYSPDEVLAFINSNVLPATFDIIDAGARYTVVEEGPFKVTTLNSAAELSDYLNSMSANTLKTVVPKREGSFFTYYQFGALVPGVNNFTMTIVDDQQSLEDAMNSIVTLNYIFEHGMKTLLISS